ncbi:hypothetical protein [Shewanella sp. SM32]|uniref:hypothetical protein n=1 Tax=Shewanella TaxID=22 RepID=UPI0021D93703|nr:hypothetical protein [Shewanella sp. SM32]MCU8069531.1 hypothetical protein [Shewanella sp. SM32]
MDKILNLVLETVKEIGEDQNNQELIDATEDTRLFGENLDSMGIVFLVTDLESLISDDLGVDLTLADERAMSQKTSPFRSVKALANYINKLIEEAKAE